MRIKQSVVRRAAVAAFAEMCENPGCVGVLAKGQFVYAAMQPPEMFDPGSGYEDVPRRERQDALWLMNLGTAALRWFEGQRASASGQVNRFCPMIFETPEDIEAVATLLRGVGYTDTRKLGEYVVRAWNEGLLEGLLYNP